MNIYVDDKLKAEYDDAVAKLKAGKYENKIPEAEKLKLEEKVMRWLLIEKLQIEIEELNQGASPYDYEGRTELPDLDKALK